MVRGVPNLRHVCFCVMNIAIIATAVIIVYIGTFSIIAVVVAGTASGSR